MSIFVAILTILIIIWNIICFIAPYLFIFMIIMGVWSLISSIFESNNECCTCDENHYYEEDDDD